MQNVSPQNYKKAIWIAQQTGHDADDCLDVILGNITHPSQFVAEVEMRAADYDMDYASHSKEIK